MNRAARTLITIPAAIIIAVLVLIVWLIVLPLVEMFAESLGILSYIVFGILALCCWYYFADLVWRATAGEKKEG